MAFSELPAADAPGCPELAPLDINEFNRSANPLICDDCNRDTLISKLNIVPLDVEPFSTAAGCGWSGGGSDAMGTGTMPSACNAESEVTGNWTGIGTPEGV